MAFTTVLRTNVLHCDTITNGQSKKVNEVSCTFRVQNIRFKSPLAMGRAHCGGPTTGYTPSFIFDDDDDNDDDDDYDYY